MARIDIADGPGGDAVQVWKLRSKMAKGVVELTEAAYQHSQLPVRGSARSPGCGSRRSTAASRASTFELRP